ncbi:MAG TPA: hypothetical protein VJM74_03780 [Nitrososphaeraceae archaeon]|nr:hypothetical protein [Nitrososphaeraceae archaeon]
MDKQTGIALKRQIPFLAGGTVTGVIMTYYFGFFFTILANSIIWYMVSHITYKFVWRKSSLADQKVLLNYFKNKIRTKKYASH